MNLKEMISKFIQEFSLSEEYEIEINQDDGGKTLDVTVPQAYAKDARKKLPRRWRKLRVLVMFRRKREFVEDNEKEKHTRISNVNT